MDWGAALCQYISSSGDVGAIGVSYDTLYWPQTNTLPKPTESVLRAAYQVYSAAKAISDANGNIKAQLDTIDQKKIRALTDALLTGDSTRIQALETHATALRAQWRS